MKFSSALTILAASGAASATILERQVQAIIGVVNGINTEVGNLDTAIKGYSGGDAKGLIAASQKTLDTVNKGVETVNAASPITLTDSVQIQGQVQNLQSSLEGVVTDLLSKKSDLVAAGEGQTTYKSLQDQLTAAKALSTAISSKVPPEVKSLADTLSQGIITALNKGVEGFKDAPAGSGSASGSAPSAPSAAAGGATTSSTTSGSAAGAGAMAGMGGAAAAPASGSSLAGQSGSGSTGTSGAGAAGAAAAKPATATGTGAPKPATYTGAAPHAVAGSFAIFVAAFVALAL